ncbi:MAG: sucrase ferredoxin [Actinomycetota bacterium]|nr:sucrase ferredoxin [Actinomycetota bacterium]
MISCSADALEAGESLAGTAPEASVWVVVEQAGPWGRDALTDSRLPVEVSAWLVDAKRAGAGVLLARHPDRPQRSASPGRHAWVARCAPGEPVLRHAVLPDLHALLEWDAARVASGDIDAIGEPAGPLLTLVCTHSGRDACCAVAGRDMIGRVAARGRTGAAVLGPVWECSHVGGHRFAPVLLSLPSGALHGRVPPDATDALDAILRGDVVLDHLRGLTALPPADQAAVIEVARRTGIDPLRLSVVDGPSVTVEDPKGRAWRVDVTEVPLARDRRESCGKDQIPGTGWTCTAIQPVS